MWSIFEHRSLIKKIPKLPKDILKKYEKWKDIIILSGLEGLKMIKGFHDEALKGEWKGYRSSRLGKQYRVIYQIVKQEFYVQIIDLTAHNYRRK